MLDEKFLLYDIMDRLTRAEHDLSVAKEKLWYLKNKIHDGHIDDVRYLDELEIEREILVKRIDRLKILIEQLNI